MSTRIPSYLRTVLALPLLAAAACAKPLEAPTHSDIPPASVRQQGSADVVSLDDLTSEWRNQSGDVFRMQDLRGQVRVVAMVYTSCEATCPLILQDLKRLESAIPAARRREVSFVLVSLDPHRDTPGRLAEWATSVQLDTTRWTLLSGEDGAVREVAAALGMRYQSLSGGDIAHSNTITILDRSGAVAHQRTSLQEPISRLAEVVGELLK